ncbi:Uncharacterised protein [Mycobacteroides abscessus subsp. massiliense]|nr:Uncharacterised protein [Mycobacteroides abscessus subsp. massiliense]
MTAVPKMAMVTPNNTTVISQAFTTSLLGCSTKRFSRFMRVASRFHEDFRLPQTLRGQKPQNVSPNRELAGSSGVATRTWCPRLCSI